MKIKLTKDYERIIRTCYSSDESLLLKHHIIAPTTLEEAIKHTLKTFLDTPKLFMYELSNKGRFSGYIAIEETDVKFVKGFFLMPEYRTESGKSEFVDCMKRLLKTVIVPIYAKNIRANRFLMGNKFNFVKQLTLDNELVNVYVLQD
jgi:hypothetical protein